jgi:hypothetical protein
MEDSLPSVLPIDTETSLVLDYLLSHKMQYSQNYLREHALPFSGTKAWLRTRLEGYLREGRITFQELVALLDVIEGWGNQHIYLYKAPSQILTLWDTEESTRHHLQSLGLSELLNSPRPIVLPDTPTLSSVIWNPSRLRLVWVEKRLWRERTPQHDKKVDDMVWEAFQIHTSRGLVTFDMNLVSGDAMLMIQRLPDRRGPSHRTDYPQVRDEFEKQLEPITSISYFERIPISPAIQHIEQLAQSEVRRRQVSHRTEQGAKANWISATPDQDIFADPDIKRSRHALGNRIASLHGDFYWLPIERELTRRLHCKLYTIDQRIGVFGEHTEGDVRYVISRIRQYSKSAS